MLTSYDNGIKTAPLSGGWPEASGSAHSEPFLSLAPHRRGCWAPGDERTPTISPGALWGDRCLCHDFSAASCGRKEPGGKTESGSLLQGLGQQLDRCRCHRLGSEGASLWGERISGLGGSDLRCAGNVHATPKGRLRRWGGTQVPSWA